MKCRNCGEESRDYGFGHCIDCVVPDTTECQCGHDKVDHINKEDGSWWDNKDCMFKYNCDCEGFDQVYGGN